jgi:hypothetical protein
MIKDRLYRKLYVTSLSATGFFLPLSVWMLTFSIIVLIITWIGEGGIQKIPQLIHGKRNVLIFCIIYLVYLIWMINTSDVSFGLQELKIKLPLLIFPLAIGLSEPLNQRELRIIISFFITGVLISSMTGVILKMDTVLSGSSDTRNISIFISHIRLALMSVFAIFCSGWYFFSYREQKRSWYYLYLAAALWLTFFLFILLSLTGILVFTFILSLTVIWITFSRTPNFVKYSLIFILMGLVISTTLFIIHETKSYYKEGDAYTFPPELYTVNGNSYQHFTERKDIENGNKVWLYINEDELKKEWNLRSPLVYDSLDRKGQTIKYTLIRYLTSIGLKKDSLGVACLTTNDIANIENGITNIIFTEGKPVRSKIYEIIWQIDYYRNGGNPSGHSVTQRIQFFKTGWNIFIRAPLFGTGTGDLNKEFDLQYKLDKTTLDPNYRYLAHNQYLTFLVSFGITGFILICFSLILPVVMGKNLKSYISIVFFIIIFLSMVGEDTLETHTGISFFAYFYSLFIFGIDEGKSS